jgi:hypothetical protein
MIYLIKMLGSAGRAPELAYQPSSTLPTVQRQPDSLYRMGVGIPNPVTPTDFCFSSRMCQPAKLWR